ncbi:beta-galactosidase [Weissella cibaria]|uniref:beta-galactosidase n=1 Tax=Weissella cibaria TaxID=137591 RepID=UPI000D0ACF7C|nr:beta-galactosidase [Weissella cibaria]AVO66924.1 beta-galactosidase [Weissella cibaria]
MDTLKYGVAYYFEYLPYDRIDEDIQMMKAANINVVRIGESTWSTYEKQDNVFDFSTLIYTLNKMRDANIQVIVGTPTYALPSWLAKKHPDVMVMNHGIRQNYGARQIMDITNEHFLFHAERIIRNMLTITSNYDNVIGYQIDNETKHYHTASKTVQQQFINQLINKYGENFEQFNQDFGLDYWSNRIDNWQDFPPIESTINASLAGAFSRFQRDLVTNYLSWQANIVKEFMHDDQFVTQNFDFEWRGYSFGVQPDVDHYAAAKPLDIVGVDIYHPSQKQLTGAEISFAGDIARSTKQTNYLVLETQAQAFKNWTPYPNQLYQLAFSHIASGANMIEYWNWHSIHNSFETYWKGLLGHDFQPNPVYDEAAHVGEDFKRLSPQLVNLTHEAEVAFIVDNNSLTATSSDWMEFKVGDNISYNDVFRQLYDTFYKLNVRTDVLNPDTINLENYKLIVVPMLYTASDEFLQKLNEYVENGGHILYTFKSGVANINTKVRTAIQPGIISKSIGAHYNLFVDPNGSALVGTSDFALPENSEISDWSELLELDTAHSLATYDGPWSKYTAITENNYGQGLAWYLGTYTSNEVVRQLVQHILGKLQLTSPYSASFPLVVKTAKNSDNATLDFIFNYSDKLQELELPFSGVELIQSHSVSKDEVIKLNPWDVKIIQREVR